MGELKGRSGRSFGACSSTQTKFMWETEGNVIPDHPGDSLSWIPSVSGVQTTTEPKIRGKIQPSNNWKSSQQASVVVDDSQKIRRSIQEESTPLFRAEYLAQFMVLRDSNCHHPVPRVRVHCIGEIVVTGTSDSVVCESTSQQYVSGFNGLECTSTCIPAGAAANSTTPVEFLCEDTVVGTENSQDGPFGEIYFYCEAPRDYPVAAVASEWLEGAITWPDDTEDENGSCEEGPNSRNFRSSRLGVSCPQALVPGQRDYNFDTFFYQCSGTLVSDSGEAYDCYVGRNCAGEACVVDFSWFTLFSVPSKFDENCIGIPSQPMTSAIFEARWATVVEDTHDSACDEDAPGIRIECANGTIERVKAFTSISCDIVPTAGSTLDSTMECFFRSPRPVNRFSLVTYRCTAMGSVIPTTNARYIPASSAGCSTNRQGAVQLGVQCEDENNNFETFISTGDRFFDCSRGSRIGYYNATNHRFGTDSRYTCNSISAVVPSVTISTDSSWSDPGTPSCLTSETVLVAETSAPTLAPTSAPTPTTSSPTAAPTETVTNVPIGLPIDPTQQSSRVIPSQDSSSSNVSIGVIAGILVTVVLVALLVGVVLWRRTKQNSGGAGKEKPTNNLPTRGNYPSYGVGENGTIQEESSSPSDRTSAQPSDSSNQHQAPFKAAARILPNFKDQVVGEQTFAGAERSTRSSSPYHLARMNAPPAVISQRPVHRSRLVGRAEPIVAIPVARVLSPESVATSNRASSTTSGSSSRRVQLEP